MNNWLLIQWFSFFVSFIVNCRGFIDIVNNAAAHTYIFAIHHHHHHLHSSVAVLSQYPSNMVYMYFVFVVVVFKSGL